MSRSSIYNTLSLCYVYPDERVCSWILEGEWIQDLEASMCHLAEDNFREFIEPFKEVFLGKQEEVRLEMAREYTRLFINGFPRVVAPPYGSVYIEKEGLVFGRTTSEILQFYNEMGFTLKEDLHDIPDHIAHELEFMGILTGQEAQTSGSKKVRLEEVQMNFLARFILPWVPVFCEKIVKGSRAPFYSHLGNLTREFITFEKNYLGIPEELNSPKNMESEIRGG